MKNDLYKCPSTVQMEETRFQIHKILTKTKTPLMIAEFWHWEAVYYQSLVSFLVKNAFLAVERKDPSILSSQSSSRLTLYLDYFRDNAVVISAMMAPEVQR